MKAPVGAATDLLSGLHLSQKRPSTEIEAIRKKERRHSLGQPYASVGDASRHRGT
jgi:hypothetical protein